MEVRGGVGNSPIPAPVLTSWFTARCSRTFERSIPTDEAHIFNVFYTQLMCPTLPPLSQLGHVGPAEVCPLCAHNAPCAHNGLGAHCAHRGFAGPKEMFSPRVCRQLPCCDTRSAMVEPVFPM